MRTLKTTTLLLILIVSAAMPAMAQDRALSWDSLIVYVQLDAQGALHVMERHAMRFDGAWNGGERVFQLRSWQRLSLQGVREVDSNTQAVTPWREGDLSEVGEYRLDGNVLRWRSRMPTDPPFANAVRTYEIAYTIEGALVPDDGRYRLEHDLAFPDRSGVIRTFDAALDIDAAWDAAGVPTRWHEENLQPGESVFVKGSLRHIGAEQPAAVARVTLLPSATAAPMLRYALLGSIIVFMIAHVTALLRRERGRGRFEPSIPLADVDEHWLRANVFDRPPEVVGAAWDLDTAESEVSALLAKLAQQGALKTEVRSSGGGWLKRDILYMELLCDRQRLSDHERVLIDALFIGGSNLTDTQKIREHYSKSGFTPAALIRRGIETQLPMVFANRLAVPLYAKLLTLVLAIAGIGATIVGIVRAQDQEFPLLVSASLLFGSYVVGLVFAYGYRVSVYGLRGRLLATLVCLCVMYAVLAFILLSGKVAVVPIGLVGLTLLALGCMNSVFNMMRIRERDESLELRRRLATARAYFEQELKSPRPRLKDEWFPYLLAFGLGRKIDRWFKSIAPAGSRTTHASRTPSGGSISSSSASGPTAWTGGGGAFGGAGATGAWAAAVGSIAAGVAKPSSGSSGRSSGGGSSRSSGGGGGGGW